MLFFGFFGFFKKNIDILAFLISTKCICRPVHTWFHAQLSQKILNGIYCTYILLQHETARALDNKWFRRSISDRDRFSTWQHISDDVASTSLLRIAWCPARGRARRCRTRARDESSLKLCCCVRAKRCTIFEATVTAFDLARSEPFLVDEETWLLQLFLINFVGSTSSIPSC